MKQNIVITIGRQFGSGGRDVAIHLAELMGVNYYDKKLIFEAARRSGLSDEYIENVEEKTPGRLFYAFTLGYGFNSGFSTENVFNIQSDTIKEIAGRESCIIVGRCADYVLRDYSACFNVFVHAPENVRIKTVSKRKNINCKEASDLIRKIDKSRAAYYDFYTNKKWGASSSYHLSVDSSMLGIEKTAEYIRSFIKLYSNEPED
ncbi:MAG: cytidylate kinase-like family protein [Prevotellaceae bacterium]|jgi:cytidylate kinase|nr:cytidylate kinase-like family protein [Prevotellaceae bacterium]